MLPTRLLAAALPASLLAAGCATTEPGEPIAPPVCPTETRGWTAWVSAMPGPGATPTLIVQGEVLLPAGAEAKLTVGPTDRMMPPGQRVALSVAAADRAGGWQQVRLDLSPALPAYSSVIVGCDGNTVATISPVEVAR